MAHQLAAQSYASAAGAYPTSGHNNATASTSGSSSMKKKPPTGAGLAASPARVAPPAAAGGAGGASGIEGKAKSVKPKKRQQPLMDLTQATANLSLKPNHAAAAASASVFAAAAAAVPSLPAAAFTSASAFSPVASAHAVPPTTPSNSIRILPTTGSHANHFSPSTPAAAAAAGAERSESRAGLGGGGGGHSDTFSEGDLLCYSNEWIYTRCPSATLPPSVAAALGGFDSIQFSSPVTPGASVSSRRTVLYGFDFGFPLLGEKANFKTPLETRIFSARETMRDEFERLYKPWKNRSRLASSDQHATHPAATATSAVHGSSALEDDVRSFLVRTSQPANFFWFALELFVTRLVEECWAGAEGDVAKEGLSTKAVTNMEVRMSQPAIQDKLAGGERKQSGAGLMQHQQQQTPSTPRATNGPPMTVRKTSTSSFASHHTRNQYSHHHQHHHHNSNPHHHQQREPSSSPPLGFTPSHLVASMLFPDRQEFFARFILAASAPGGSAAVVDGLRVALLGKIHQLCDLVPQQQLQQQTTTGGVGDAGVSSSWRFSPSLSADLVRTWSARTMKLKLLGKFLALTTSAAHLDVATLALHGASANNGQASQAMLQVVTATANATNVLTFPPFSTNTTSGGAASSTGGLFSSTPALALPLLSYLSFARASGSLALFLPWICAFLRVLKLDAIQLSNQQTQRVLQELADTHGWMRNQLEQARRHQRMASATAGITVIQRTYSSPLQSLATFQSITDSPSLTATAPAATAAAAAGTLTPIVSTRDSPLQSSSTHLSEMSRGLHHHISPSFETDVTPPRTPGGPGSHGLDDSFEAAGSGTDSPFMLMRSGGGGGGGGGGGSVGASGGSTTMRMFSGSPQVLRSGGASMYHRGSATTTTSTQAPVLSSSVQRLYALLVFELEDLFDELQLDLQTVADDAAHRRRKEREAAPRATSVTVDGQAIDSLQQTPTHDVHASGAASGAQPKQRLLDPAASSLHQTATATTTASPQAVHVEKRAPRSLLGSFDDAAKSTLVAHPPVRAATSFSIAAAHTVAAAAASSQTASMLASSGASSPIHQMTTTAAAAGASAGFAHSLSSTPGNGFHPQHHLHSQSTLDGGVSGGSRLVPLDHLPGLISSGASSSLFLSLFTTTSTPSRKDQLKAVINGGVEPMLVALGEYAAETALNPSGSAAAPASLATIGAPLLQRQASQKVPQRIAPTAVTGAASSSRAAQSERARLVALDRLKTVFFRSQKDLADLVHKTSTTLERHLVNGHILAEGAVAAAMAAEKAWEATWQERWREIDQTRSLGDVDAFLLALAADLPRLTSPEVIAQTRARLLPSIESYLLTSAGFALRALASPDHPPSVLETATQLTCFLTLQSSSLSRDRLAVWIENRMKAHTSAWSKKLRKVWEEKRKQWTTTAEQQPPPATQPPPAIVDRPQPTRVEDQVAVVEPTEERSTAVAVPSPAPIVTSSSSPPPGVPLSPRELSERAEIGVRVRNAHEAFRQLMSELHAASPAALGVAPANGVASSSSSSANRSPPFDGCQWIRQALQPLAINCHAAVLTSTPTQAASVLRPLLLLAGGDAPPTSLNLFEHAAVALDALLTASNLRPARPTDLDKCWSLLDQLYCMVSPATTSAQMFPTLLSKLPTLSPEVAKRIRQIVGDVYCPSHRK